MGKRGLPPLRRGEIIDILTAAGFAFKPAQGSNRHDVWDHQSVHGHPRTVPVKRSQNEFSGDLLRAMIRQSGMSKSEFYGMTAATARKMQCKFLRDGLTEAPQGEV